jgi:hypothetical protein
VETGYIKLFRKVIHCGFFNNPNLAHFWVWCLCKASHKEHKLSVGYQVVTLRPGQFIFGRKNASLETGLSHKSVRTCLDHLCKLENIVTKPTNKFTIVTICKWDSYQNEDLQDGQQTASRRPADGQQVATNKNVKNDKNVKNTAFEHLWNRYPRKLGKDKAYKSFIKTVLSAQDWADIQQALDNYLKNLPKEEQFIKHGSTWFNGWRDWVNYTSPVEKTMELL